LLLFLLGGSSKRIPNKNIKCFLGKPIISYSIEKAKRSGLFDKLIVSTDSDEIANIAVQYGAEIPFKRPAELADDFTGSDPVLIHAIEWLNANDTCYDFACCIYPTASGAISFRSATSGATLPWQKTSESISSS